jgi:hypothetical protein
MAAAKRNVNWRTVTFTPTSGSATTFTGVSGISINTGGSTLKFSGDADRFVTTLVQDFQDISITITTADLAAANANPLGTTGAFSAVNKDAHQQTSTSGAGDITIGLANAMIVDNPYSGQHRQFSQATVNLASYSTDGVTSPLTVTVA